MKILFPTDFSETAQNAFQHALLFADRTGAEIHTLHIVYPVADAIDIPVVATEVIQEQIEAAKVVMQEFIAYGNSKVVLQLANTPKVCTEIIVGVPASTINRIIHKESFDLVVMGSKRQHGTIEKILGTVSASVVAQANCPVLIIPETALPSELGTVLYATDMNEADPFEIWKTTQLLAPLNAVFRIVHVQNNKNTQKAAQALNKLEDYFEQNPVDIKLTFHQLTNADVEVAIQEFAKIYDADLVVMYRPHRSFVDRLFRSSHTSRMMKKTDVPLLVMKDQNNRSRFLENQ